MHGPHKPSCNAGSIPIAQDIYEELLSTGEFDVMDIDVDEVKETESADSCSSPLPVRLHTVFVAVKVSMMLPRYLLMHAGGAQLRVADGLFSTCHEVC